MLCAWALVETDGVRGVCFITSKKGRVFPSLSFCLSSSSQLLVGSLVLVPEFIVCFCGLLKQWKTRAAVSVDSGVLQLWWIKEGLAKYLDSAEEKMGYDS